jgi:hypothetical protein
MKVIDQNGNELEVEVSDHGLIKELESRGYITGLLFCREDVQYQLDTINSDLEDEGLEAIDMEDDDKDYILESLSLDWHIERFNESIFDKVLEFVDDIFSELDEEIDDED